ncbi:MAG: sel1 repeat family protein [Methanomassiliicoccaceae archaeon]|nr:sel1 repeat family protein [Methanomassiliicoccaceae archaeon]
MEDDEYSELDEAYYEAVSLVVTGKEDDLKAAAELFTKAAGEGHMPSRKALGFMYLDGKGIERNLTKAFELISEAAGNLDPAAVYVLGRMCEGGLGVEQNDVEAQALFELAAELGMSVAREDSDRLSARIAERRNRKLRSRPILELEISETEFEAVCCEKMLDSVVKGTFRISMATDTPTIVRDDENGITAYDNCPFCGKRAVKVSKNKIY